MVNVFRKFQGKVGKIFSLRHAPKTNKKLPRGTGNLIILLKA
jgi:hypothetical protein